MIKGLVPDTVYVSNVGYHAPLDDDMTLVSG